MVQIIVAIINLVLYFMVKNRRNNVKAVENLPEKIEFILWANAELKAANQTNAIKLNDAEVTYDSLSKNSEHVDHLIAMLKGTSALLPVNIRTRLYAI